MHTYYRYFLDPYNTIRDTIRDYLPFQVIVVDWDNNATKMHPDNTFGIARWHGNDDDVQLLDLVAFLKSKFIYKEDKDNLLNYHTIV